MKNFTRIVQYYLCMRNKKIDFTLLFRFYATKSKMSNLQVKYILHDKTGIDTMLNHVRSTKLQTITIILIGLFAIFSALLNLILLITILLSRKLRSIQLFILFCNLAILNIFDILSGMFIPILFIINDNWLSDTTICRWSVTFEQVYFIIL
uniref:G_PROTEIN_RECEP_F1_2 domain-containing protein n=1 Tax=Wuchereria bancrofti TaxID=6293 RepID=A0A1I8EF54_WUCBA